MGGVYGEQAAVHAKSNTIIMLVLHETSMKELSENTIPLTVENFSLPTPSTGNIYGAPITFRASVVKRVSCAGSCGRGFPFVTSHGFPPES